MGHTSKYAVKIKDLTKSFDITTGRKETLKSYFVNPFSRPKTKRITVLEDISLDIHDGEFVGIMGRNGSGKSTLLKLIAGIYTPDHGIIKTDGKVVPFLELGVGFNPELTAAENIFLNGTILGMERSYLRKKFDAIVEYAELEEFMGEQVKNLSSGMQLRLAFSIAIQAEGDIYILDEVLAVGDSVFQKKSLRTISELKKRGKTILFVSHSAGDVQKFCDRAILIDRGHVIFDGDPSTAVYKYEESNRLRNDIKFDSAAQDHDNANRSQLDDVSNYRVDNVVLTDKNGHERQSFDSGEDIIINVNYETLVKKPILNCNIGLHSIDNHVVMFGIDTKADNFFVDQKSQVIKLILPKNILNSGNYYLSCQLFGDDFAQEVYHRVPFATKLIINKNDANVGGVVVPERQWSTH